eukprot:7358935-Pyramimonas_sp.AAC.1
MGKKTGICQPSLRSVSLMALIVPETVAHVVFSGPNRRPRISELGQGQRTRGKPGPRQPDLFAPAQHKNRGRAPRRVRRQNAAGS